MLKMIACSLTGSDPMAARASTDSLGSPSAALLPLSNDRASGLPSGLENASATTSIAGHQPESLSWPNRDIGGDRAALEPMPLSLCPSAAAAVAVLMLLCCRES